MDQNKQFSSHDCAVLEDVILHRRDVRGHQFIDRDVSDAVIDKLLFAALNGPSVGFSQPWEYVVIRDLDTKRRVRQSFDEENEKAARQFNNDQQYKKFKLEGILESPVNIAVFYKPSEMPILGQTSMYQAGLFSVVCAIQNLWLMARSLNVGLGWVSILDPEKVKAILEMPAESEMVAYLCIGYVNAFGDKPELEKLKWEKRKSKDDVVFYEKYGHPQIAAQRRQLTGVAA